MLKNPLGQNKNGSGSYSFSQDNYNAGKCGKGYTIRGDIPQGDSKYDAARANMGEPWIMPTRTQCNELIKYTTNIWSTLNEVNGRVFISKSDISKSIFIPAAGYWNNTTHDSAGSTGVCITTSNYAPGGTFIWYMYFNSNNIDTSYSNQRPYGQSIRPIKL